jgi:hypothetical protein
MPICKACEEGVEVGEDGLCDECRDEMQACVDEEEFKVGQEDDGEY